MKRRGKSILRDRPGVIWLVGLAALGFVTAYVIGTSIHSAEKMATVYVAAQTIPDDTIITASEIASVNISASVVPSGVIQDPQSIIGKYADATIAKGEPILQSVVAPATTVRQLVRVYGMNFVGATVQLDPSDLPITDVEPGDLVDLVGVYGTQNQQVYTQWVAIGVPVVAVDTADSKVILVIPRADALSLVRDITVGKVRVLLDPNPFKGVVNFGTKKSATATVPTVNTKNGTAKGIKAAGTRLAHVTKNSTSQTAKQVVTTSTSKMLVGG